MNAWSAVQPSFSARAKLGVQKTLKGIVEWFKDLLNLSPETLEDKCFSESEESEDSDDEECL